MDTEVSFTSWLLWIVLLWTLGCIYLFKLQFSLGTGPGEGMQDHMIALLSGLEGSSSILFSIEAIPIYMRTNSVGRALTSLIIWHEFSQVAITPGGRDVMQCPVVMGVRGPRPSEVGRPVTSLSWWTRGWEPSLGPLDFSQHWPPTTLHKVTQELLAPIRVAGTEAVSMVWINECTHDCQAQELF